MILYLYAIAEGLQGIDEIRGAAGEPLRILVVEGIDLVAAAVPAAPPLEPQALAAQDRIVRLLHARAAALLPMRFGAAFASESQLQRALALRLPTLRERLIAVRGAEQMTLRVLRAHSAGHKGDTGAPSAQGAPGALGASGAAVSQASGAMTGVAYLRARAAKGTPREIVPLLDALHARVRATRVEAGRSTGVIATVYHLVPRGTSDEYAAAVRAVAETMPVLVIRPSGPAPCYAFT